MTELAARIVEALDDAVFSVDHGQRITFWNRRIASLTRRPADEVLGRPVFEVVPTWRITEHGHLERALAGEAAISLAFPLPGTCRYEARYQPLDDAGAVVLIRDASSTDRARYELHESDRRFQIMADTAPVLLWMAGTDSQGTFFNQPWLAFTGRPLDLELGYGWAEGIHPEDFARCMDTYLAAFVARRAFRMEYRLRRADRAYRWLLDTGVPRFLASGEFAGFIGSCIDITEAKLALDELDLRVRERTAELEAFAYSVSHDLRSPLRTIDGFSLALLEEATLDATGQGYLDRVRDAAQHMGRLIDALLQLSRVGRSALRRETVDLSAVARGVIAELGEAEPHRAATLAIADGVTAYGDPELLRIALANLLGNAWKFSRKAAHARIELFATPGEDDRGITVHIRDQGAGFDLARAAKLFGAFQRFHRDPEFPGTGIGLATVQRIVHRHGGRIWAQSSPGQGATFSFTIAGRGDDDGG